MGIGVMGEPSPDSNIGDWTSPSCCEKTGERGTEDLYSPCPLRRTNSRDGRRTVCFCQSVWIPGSIIVGPS